MNRNKNILFMEKVFQVLQCTEKSFPCFSHLRVTLKSLQFSLFSSFSFSIQQIWTDRPKLLLERMLKVSHDVNSLLHTSHPLTGNLPKVIKVFRSENLELFTVNSIQSILKSTENKNF